MSAEEAKYERTTHIQPKIRKVTNGGRVIIHFDEDMIFPDDLVEQINANKNNSETFIVMQMTHESVQPEPLPNEFPVYPVPPEVAVTVLDPVTFEQVNQETQDAAVLKHRDFL